MGDPAVKETEALEVQRPEHSLMRPVVSPGHLVEVHKEVATLIANALERGRDYGTIPGAGDKPTLLKPGAERLSIAFGTFPRYSIVASEIDHDRETEWIKRKKKWRNREFDGWEEERGSSLGLYRYVVRCELVRRADGAIVGDGLGSASTLESKYIDRPRDCENTVLKMAEKRALVAAVLNAFGLSDRFTQDVEDGDGHEDPQSSGRQAKGGKSGSKKPAGRRDEGPTPDQVALIDEWIARDDLPEKLRGWLRTRLADQALTRELAAGIIEKTRRDYPATREQEAQPVEGEPPPMDDSDAPEPGSRG